MRIIKPSAELAFGTAESPHDLITNVERAGRICYKSEDRITSDSAQKFISSIINRGHTSVLEHGNIIMQIDTSMAKHISAYIKAMAEDGKDHHLRVSYCEVSYLYRFPRYVLSGNVRALRGLSAWLVGWLVGNREMHSCIIAFLSFVRNGYGILFSDIVPEQVSEMPYSYLIAPKAMREDELTQEEKNIHATRTFHITCDRGVSHELVRHRVCSFSQESTRYCNYSNDKFGSEITVIEPCYLIPDTEAYEVWKSCCEECENQYFKLLDIGCSPQQARAVLPNSLKTELMMTATLAEWKDFCGLRCSPAAHPQAREIADIIRNTLEKEQSND